MSTFTPMAVSERRMEFEDTRPAARALHVEIQSSEVRRPEDLDDKFKGMVKGRAEALFILPDPMTNTHRTKIIEFASTTRLPTMFTERLAVDAGGLVSYATNYAAVFRRAAVYVDKILKPMSVSVEASGLTAERHAV